jgi:hypothetical protein
MDYWVLVYVSSCFFLIYLALSLFMIFRYRKIMDPFMKSNIIIYQIAFFAKPIFWYYSERLELYNLSIENATELPLVPIRSTLGSVVSAMCFMIIQIIIIRIILAYYHLKASSVAEGVKWSKVIMRGLFYHIGLYILLVSLQIVFDFENDKRLDHNYSLYCRKLRFYQQ